MTKAKRMSNRAKVNLTEDGQVIVSTVNQFGEHNIVVLSLSEAEELLYDLHSIVMTLRGHQLPANRFKRFFKR